MFHNLLTTSYYSLFSSSLISNRYTIDERKDNGELKRETENSIADTEKIGFKIYNGKRAENKKYPALGRFGIAIDNRQTASALLYELLSVMKDQNNIENSTVGTRNNVTCNSFFCLKVHHRGKLKYVCAYQRRR